MKERIVREPRRSPLLEESLPSSEVHEHLGTLRRNLDKLGEEIHEVNREIDKAVRDPSAVADHPAYMAILNKRMNILADEWERAQETYDALGEAARLARGQEMGEA